MQQRQSHREFVRLGLVSAAGFICRDGESERGVQDGPHWTAPHPIAAAFRTSGPDVALPVHAPRVGPQVFQAVVLARVGVEDVDDHVAVILHHPFAGFVALDGQRAVAFRVQGGVDFFADGVDLPAAVAGGQDEEVVQGSDASHVEDDHVAGLVVGRHAGAEAGTFERGEGQATVPFVWLRCSKDLLPVLRSERGGRPGRGWETRRSSSSPSPLVTSGPDQTSPMHEWRCCLEHTFPIRGSAAAGRYYPLYLFSGVTGVMSSAGLIKGHLFETPRQKQSSVRQRQPLHCTFSRQPTRQGVRDENRKSFVA